jgi:hypothetical protein
MESADITNSVWQNACVVGSTVGYSHLEHDYSRMPLFRTVARTLQLPARPSTVAIGSVRTITGRSSGILLLPFIGGPKANLTAARRPWLDSADDAARYCAHHAMLPAPPQCAEAGME